MVVNKKGFKICGLLLAFSIIFGLSLNASSDTNALSYGISNFEIGQDTYHFVKLYDNYSDSYVYGYFIDGNFFSIAFTEDNPAPSGFTFPHTWSFKGNLIDNNGSLTCQLPFGDSSYYSDGVDVAAFSHGSRYYNHRFDTTFELWNVRSPDMSPFDFSSPLNLTSGSWLDFNRNILCNMNNEGYNPPGENPPIDANVPSWDWSSLINIPLVNNRWEYEKSKPYTYQYNTINLKATKKEDGVVVHKDGLKMSDLFGTEVHSFNSLTMDFGLFDDIITDLSDPAFELHEDVSTFSVKGTIDFETSYTLDPSNSIYFELHNYYDPYFNSNNTSLANSIDYDGNTIYDLRLAPHSSTVLKQCSVTEYHIDNGDDSNSLDFECVYDPSTDGAMVPYVDFRFLSQFTLLFGRSTVSDVSPVEFVTTTGDYTFKNFRVVTNNNDTDAGWDATAAGITGGSPENMPGNDGYDDMFQPDWLASLKDLFSFGFFNPFAPIFSLFGDASSCASIPTIASMIHSNETTVCPWFDSNTRAILTPVLGMASVMLVFGFAVRWLGSSSGNLFEDSRHEEVSNVSGSGWRRFKK